jgi:hypothetical protein
MVWGAEQRRSFRERDGCAARRAPFGVRCQDSLCAGTRGSPCVGVWIGGERDRVCDNASQAGWHVLSDVGEVGGGSGFRAAACSTREPHASLPPQFLLSCGCDVQICVEA